MSPDGKSDATKPPSEDADLLSSLVILQRGAVILDELKKEERQLKSAITVACYNLLRRCDAMPKAHLTYIVTAYGKPRSNSGSATTSRAGPQSRPAGALPPARPEEERHAPPR
jgi:hypothetical protein